MACKIMQAEEQRDLADTSLLVQQQQLGPGRLSCKILQCGRTEVGKVCFTTCSVTTKSTSFSRAKVPSAGLAQ
jgi:hypothetical protein